MSKKPYKSEEMQEHEKKIKKQNKILFILLILFFIPPLCLFPAYPKTYWQYNIYEYITKKYADYSRYKRTFTILHHSF